MVLSADGMTACFQRHDVIAGGIGKQIKQRIEGTVFQIFHGGDNGGGPVFAHPSRGQSLELGDQVGAARRPIRLAPRQVDPGFENPRFGADDHPGGQSQWEIGSQFVVARDRHLVGEGHRRWIVRIERPLLILAPNNRRPRRDRRDRP